MGIIDIVEGRGSADRVRAYSRLLLVGVLGLIALKAIYFSGIFQHGATRTLVDFDVFYVAGTMAWHSGFDRAYDLAAFMREQHRLLGASDNLPWSYPPLFGLVAAALAPMPEWLAYAGFMATTLAAFLFALVKLGGRWPVGPLLIAFLPVVINIAAGQNGFLTAALIGLTCWGLLSGRSWAGVPLGLLVIKPHLAVGLAIYVLLDRRWTVIGVAALTVVATSALAALVLGPSVWPAFLAAAGTAGHNLALGLYPMFRMTSPYAALRTLGLAAPAAMLAQVAVALTAIGGIVVAIRRLPARFALGFAVFASLLISPYCYDYDLPALAVALALLLPGLAVAGKAERVLLYLLIAGASLFGMVGTGLVAAGWTARGSGLPTVAGLLLLLALMLAARMLNRHRAAFGA